MSTDLRRRVFGFFRCYPGLEAGGWKGVKAVDEGRPGAFSEKTVAPNDHQSEEDRGCNSSLSLIAFISSSRSYIQKCAG